MTNIDTIIEHKNKKHKIHLRVLNDGMIDIYRIIPAVPAGKERDDLKRKIVMYLRNELLLKNIK